MKQFWAMILLLTLPLGAQTNNIGNTIPASAFGFSTYDTTLTPLLPYTVARAWDAPFHASWAYLNQCANTYTWANLDLWTAQNAGKDMLYTFGTVPDWAASDPSANTPYPLSGGYPCADGSTSTGGTSCSMPSLTAWDAFVTAIATHAPQIKYWELWNEPMNYQYWCAGSSGPYNTKPTAHAQFALMSEHAYKIIKSIIPGAIIVSPSTDKNFGIAWLNDDYAQIPACTTGYTVGCNGVVAWDVTAIHGYSDNAPEGIVAMVQQYGAWNSGHGATGKPIWDTEVALSTSAPAPPTDNVLLARLYILEWSSGVSRTIWYGYDHLSVVPLYASGALTGQGIAYQQVYNWMTGAKMTSACSQDGAGTYTCPLSRTGYAGIMVWNPTATVAYPTAGYTQYRDLSGNTTGLGSASTVSVAGSPILLEYTGVPTNLQVL